MRSSASGASAADARRLALDSGAQSLAAGAAQVDAGAAQLADGLARVGEHERLAGAVRRLAGQRLERRRRRDIQHRAAAARHHARQQGAGHRDQAGAVGGDHGFPVFQLGFVSAFDAEGQAGVINQDIDFLPVRGEGGQSGMDGAFVGDVQFYRQQVRAEFASQGFQALGAAAGGDNLMAVLDENTRHRGAKTSGCAGN